MSLNVTQKLIQSHLLHGDMTPGEEVGIRIDQTLTQDATGTLVMLELEAMALDRVKTEVSVQYVDHNIIQEDYKNPDDHLFLRSACQRFGLWSSRPGNGVSHPCREENFGKPGKTLLGSDSHTPAADAIGMLAIGAGGLEVALAMAGEAFFTRIPLIWGREVHRQAAGLGERQGRDLGDVAPPRRGGRSWQDRRVLWTGASHVERDGSARDRQHGRRDRRDHHRFPFRSGGKPLPARLAARRGMGRTGRRYRCCLRRAR